MMNWYAEQRQAWIKEMLRVYGYINRHHICEKFGCSAQAAGKDLTLFQEENAGWVQYEPRRRSYINTTYDHPLQMVAAIN